MFCSTGVSTAPARRLIAIAAAEWNAVYPAALDDRPRHGCVIEVYGFSECGSVITQSGIKFTHSIKNGIS